MFRGAIVRGALSGWRRVGIVMAAFWFLGIANLGFWEYSTKADGFFVYQGVPLATVVAGNRVPLADGQIIRITAQHEMSLRFKRGEDTSDQPLDHRELEWLNLTALPTSTQVHRWHALIFGLLAPLTTWLLVEGLVFTSNWVRGGFDGEVKDC
jgi:hypothetical protein